MATLNTTKPGATRNILQNLLGPALAAVRPVAKDGKVTIFRPIPEVAHDGSILPMVRSMTPAGPDFSNVTVETCTVGVGEREDFKVTMLGRPSDEKIDRPVNMILPGLYIRLKAKDKKGEVPDHLYRRVNELLKPNDKGFSKLSRPQDLAIIQGVLLQLNGEPLPKPAPRQAIFLSATARDAVAAVLSQASERGIDVFDPDAGYCIEIGSIPPGEGRMTASFTAKLGQQMRIPEEQCRALWTPWELPSVNTRGLTGQDLTVANAINTENANKQGLKLLTLDEQLDLAVKAFDEELLAFAFPEYFTDRPAYKSAAAKPAPAATKPAPAPAPSKPKPAMSIDIDVTAPPPQVDAQPEDELIDMKPKVSSTPAAAPRVSATVTSSTPTPEELQAQIQALLEQQMKLQKK